MEDQDWIPGKKKKKTMMMRMEKNNEDNDITETEDLVEHLLLECMKRTNRTLHRNGSLEPVTKMMTMMMILKMKSLFRILVLHVTTKFSFR